MIGTPTWLYYFIMFGLFCATFVILAALGFAGWFVVNLVLNFG